jgi:tetratricopeptide (TPR) repeat protein
VRVRLEESALALSTGDYDVTKRAAHQAVAEADALLGPGSDESAQAMMFESKALIFTDQASQAAVAARRGLDILLANHHQDYAHPKLIEYAPYYANALIHTGDFEGGANLMREILAHAKRVYGERAGIVAGLSDIGVPAEMERGDLDAAISLARNSLGIFEPGDPDTPIRAYRLRLLGLTLVTARAGDEGLRVLEDAVRMSGKMGNPNAGRGSLALALAYAGRLDEAGKELRQLLERAPAGSYPFLLGTMRRGTVLRFEAKSAEAIPLLEQAVAGLAESRSNRGDHAVGLVELGLAQLEVRELPASAHSFTVAASELDDLQKDRMTPVRADLLIGTARLRMQRGEFAQALPDLQRAEAYWHERQPESRWAGEAELWLGRDLLALGHRAEARAALDRAAKLLGRSKTPADQGLVKLARAS